MNAKSTWYLALATIILFAFIMLWERQPAGINRANTPAGRVFPGLTPRHITQIELMTRSNMFVHLVRTNDQWLMIQPVRFPAHSARIERFLEGLRDLTPLSQLTAQDQRRQKQGPAAFGLDPAQVTVILRQGEGRMELHLGDRTPVGEAMYLQVVGMDELKIVPDDLVSRLPQQVDDWRDHTLLGMKPIQFDRFEVRMAAPFGFTLEKDTNQLWHLSQPWVVRADNAKVNHLIHQLQNAVVTRFLPDGARTNLEMLGLQPPRLELVLGSATNDLLQLRFGTSPTNASSEVYGWQNLHGQVFCVARGLVDNLSVPYLELRDRRLVSIPLNTANSIEIRADEHFALQLQTNGQWLITSPAPMPADRELVRNFLQKLNQLEVVEFTKDVVTDFSTYGLANPSRQIMLKHAYPDAAHAVTNELVIQLDFGTNQTDRILVRRSDEKSVYALRLADFLSLPQAAYQLRERRAWSFAVTNIQSLTFTMPGQTNHLRHLANGKWETTLPNQVLPDPLPLMIDELAHRLGSLQVDAWIGRGADNLAAFGLRRPAALTWEAQLADPPISITLELGDPMPQSGGRYAAIVLDQQPMIFQLPSTLSSLLVELLRSLPPTPNPGTSSPQP
jgi:hypothetical protein